MCQNLLQLNQEKKAKVIVFGPKITNQARNPGVIMDSDLNFNIRKITK